jgi:hypothetical protein
MSDMAGKAARVGGRTQRELLRYNADHFFLVVPLPLSLASTHQTSRNGFEATAGLSNLAHQKLAAVPPRPSAFFLLPFYFFLSS